MTFKRTGNESAAVEVNERWPRFFGRAIRLIKPNRYGKVAIGYIEVLRMLHFRPGTIELVRHAPDIAVDCMDLVGFGLEFFKLSAEIICKIAGRNHYTSAV